MSRDYRLIKNGSEEEVEISERYDKEDDIYYVTLRTGEPSIAVECDDKFLLERGIFTRMPTGFRILSYSKRKLQTQVFCEVFKKICKAAGLRKIKAAASAEKTLKREMEKALEAVEV